MLKAEWNNSPLGKKQQTEILFEVSRALKIKKDLEVSVAFISPSVIRRLNRIYRGKDKVTDVLSFPFNDQENIGEVLICLSRAKSQAKEFKHSPEEEITILLVHGIIHLFGYDHIKKSAAAEMFGLQKKVLKKLGINWLSPGHG